jgi:hypothetical protein
MRFELIVLIIVMDAGPAHDLMPQCSARGKPATDQTP